MTIILILFALAQVGDIVSTYLVISRGKGYEANPVMRWLIGKIGLLPGLIAPKLVAMGLFIWMAADGRFGIEYVLVPATLVYAWVVRNNFKIAVK